MTAPGLAVESVSKSFGAVEVLHGVDLTVPAGALTAVLGRSGCGKTTLLRIVAGFERPDAGSVALGRQRVAGADVVLPPERRGVGYVTQEGSLFPHLRVADNIAFGLPRRERRHGHRVAEVLELVELDPGLRTRYPHELSGGQQQRVALARALAPAPSIVLLDEPFSSLDTELRVSTRRAVADALARAGTTALLVTHDQTEALSVAGHVAVMRDGRVAQSAPPATLYHHPADLEIATFVGEAVVLDGAVESDAVTCALGTLPLSSPSSGSGPVRVVVRPEQLLLERPSGSAGNGVAARVLATTFYGHDRTVELVLDHSSTRVTARSAGPDGAAVGDEVEIVVRGPVTAFSR